MKCFLLCFFAIGIAASGLAQNLARSLIQGAWAGQPAAVRGALASGRVNVDVTTEAGDTPLMLASLAGHGNVIDILLEGGADPNLANDAGETALILASKYGFNVVAAALIEAGADVNTQDASGRSPWTWASWGENEKLVSLLKASGADGSGKVDPFDGGAPVDRFETTPDMTKYKSPKMPKELKKTGIEGTLRLRLVVGRDGRTSAIELVEGIHDELDRNALEASKKWRFDPGEVQNKPVDGIVTMSLIYAPGRDERVVTSTRRWRN